MEQDYSEVLLELKHLIKKAEDKLLSNQMADAIDIAALLAANGRRLRYVLEKKLYGY